MLPPSKLGPQVNMHTSDPWIKVASGSEELQKAKLPSTVAGRAFSELPPSNDQPEPLRPRRTFVAKMFTFSDYHQSLSNRGELNR